MYLYNLDCSQNEQEISQGSGIQGYNRNVI